MKKMKQGFTLVEIMIVVAIIGLLAAIAIPSFMKARTTSQANACINNLRQIEAGKEQWALAAKVSPPQDCDSAANMTAIMAYIKNPTAVTNCPGGGTVTFGFLGTNAACTLSSATPPHALLN